MSLVAFDRSGTPTRRAVEARDHGVCALCGMDTDYVKSLARPYLSEAARHQAEGDLIGASQLRLIVIGFLSDLGFSRAICVRTVEAWGGIFGAHLWEADHMVPVIHGGGGSCGLENMRTLCRACHQSATAHLAYVRAKDKRVKKKRGNHGERMAMKARGEELPLSKKWRR